MKQLDLTYRITKIGGRAVSVAVCALTGMMFMGSAMAQTTVTLGATTAGASGTLFYNSDIQTYDNGAQLGAPTNTITNTNGGSTTNRTGSIRNTTYVANIFSALGTVNGYGSTDNYILGTGAIIKAQTTGTAATGQYSWINNYYGGGGYANTTWTGSLGAASTTNPYAINTTGTVALNGNNTIDGTATASTFNVAGSGVYFNGNVTGDLTYTTAGSATLAGGSGMVGNVNFLGNNATLTLSNGSNITGNITTAVGNQSGTVNFEGSSHITGSVGGAGTLQLLQANGTAGTVVQIEGLAKAETLNLQSGVVALVGGINTTRQDGSLGSVNFGNYDGIVQIGNGGGLVGNVTTGANNTGTLTFVGANDSVATSTVTGAIGSSNAYIKTLNIGAAGSIGIAGVTGTANATVVINNDVYAQGVVFNNDATGTSHNSNLTMASGKNLTTGSGNITTAQADSGVLNLAGGTQTVNGTVGTTTARLNTVNSGANGATSNFGADVFSVNVTNTGTGTSNFATNVTGTNINVNSGVSNFTNNATAITTTIGTGVGNFNTNGAGVTTSAIVFSADRTQTTTPSILGSATANLHTGLTGNIDFASKDAVVNVWDGKTITGAVTSTGATAKDGTNGILNFQGAGAITGNIGSTVDTGISQLNINTAGASTKTVAAGGDIYAEAINLKNAAVLTLAAGKNIVGTTATALTGAQPTITTDVANTGTLTLLGSGHTVTGVVGANGMAFATVNAGSGTDTFNNTVYAQTLNFTGNGLVVLNGQAGLMANGTAGTSANSSNAGLIGTVDFGTNGSPTAGTGNFGTLQIGDGVNLTTGASGINFKDANGATLTFAGNSTVTGVVGSSANTDNNVFKTINAGAAGKTVTFKNDVYVSELGSVPTHFHVTDTGTVNFEGDLHSQLVFNNGADGTVNVSAGKSLIVTLPSTPAAVSTVTSQGTINFLGATTLSADLGVTGTNLKAVNFNTASNNVTQTINKNVFADTVTIGGAAGTTTISKRDVTGVYDYAGATSLFTFAGGTTANLSNVGTTGAIALGGNLVIANATTAVNVGVAHVATGNVTTNGGALSFTVNSTDITTGGSTSTSAGSGQVTATGALTMTGTEKVHVNYVGSLANAGTYTLVATGSGSGAFNLGNETAGKVSDNSFSIDTSVRQATAADVTALRATRLSDLIVVADRTAGATYAANQNYIQKAGTVGDYTNNAGIVLGGIAAAGTQTGDMVKVIQMLEIDSFGYGNTAANLATQVKRLAPVVNASVTRSALAASGLSLNALGVRMSALRGGTQVSSNDAVQSGLSSGDAVINSGVWLKALGSTTSQNKQDAYDGYSAKLSGLAVGADKQVSSDLVLGLALGLTRADVDQEDFRSGDTTRINNTQLMGYGTYDITPALYVEGALSYAGNTYANKRAAAVGRTATADFNGSQLGARIGLGYGIDLGNKTKITPMASVDFTRLNQDAYTETGAGAINLSVASQSVNNTRVGLGARLTRDYDAGATTYRPEVSLNWYQDSNAANNDVVSSFVGGGSSFVTPGASSSNRSGVNLGLALTVASNKTTSIQVRYDLDKSSGYTAQTGSLVARWEY